jgi:membrane associated rhomboid family serine protease
MDRLLARLERKLGRYAIPGFTWYLVGLQSFVFVMELTNPGFSQYLALDRELVLQGQVWRLLTYLFIPPTTSPIWVLFELYWLYTMGTALEAEWGTFKYQVYWLSGMLFTTVGAFALGVPATNVYLLMSLFLAFATHWPDFEIRVFFLVPVAVKWLALLDGLMLLGMIGMAQGPARLIPVLAVGNYLLFFHRALIDQVRRGAFRARRARAFDSFRRAVREPGDRPRARRCALCGVTDADPNVEFRVCSCAKCGQATEYCLAHARNH